MVGVGGVGVGLIGPVESVVGVVEGVVVVECQPAPGVVVRWQELVMVGVLPPKNIRELSFCFS